MTGAACILLPLLFAAVHRWLPPWRWLAPAVAGVALALALSLPWTGDSLGGWLLTDPLAVHVTMLSAFAWLAVSGYAALDGPDAPPAAAALTVACVNLALLSDGAGLGVAAAGVAAACAPARLAVHPVLACGLGVAVFGVAVLGGAAAPALGPGWASLSWSALPDAGPRADGLALGVGFGALLLGLGAACTLLPVWAAVGRVALPRTAAVLAGPLGGVWLVMALRLRGVLDGDGHAMAPGGPMLAVALAALALAAVCARRPGRLLPAATVAMLGASLFGFGLGGAGATGAGLLHLTLGCLALTAAAAPGWPGTLGTASLAALPPLGLFASVFALLTAAFTRAPLLAAPFGLLLAVVALSALPALAVPLPGAWPGSRAGRLGWVGFAMTLLGGWAMPPAVGAWLQGIAAAAR